MNACFCRLGFDPAESFRGLWSFRQKTPEPGNSIIALSVASCFDYCYRLRKFNCGVSLQKRQVCPSNICLCFDEELLTFSEQSLAERCKLGFSVDASAISD